MPPMPGSHIVPAASQSGGCGGGQQFGSSIAQPQVAGSAMHGSLQLCGSVGSAQGGGGSGGHMVSPGLQVGGGHAPAASHLQYGSVGSAQIGGGGMQFGSVGSVHMVPQLGSPG